MWDYIQNLVARDLKAKRHTEAGQEYDNFINYVYIINQKTTHFHIFLTYPLLTIAFQIFRSQCTNSRTSIRKLITALPPEKQLKIHNLVHLLHL